MLEAPGCSARRDREALQSRGAKGAPPAKGRSSRRRRVLMEELRTGDEVASRFAPCIASSDGRRGVSRRDPGRMRTARAPEGRQAAGQPRAPKRETAGAAKSATA